MRGRAIYRPGGNVLAQLFPQGFHALKAPFRPLKPMEINLYVLSVQISCKVIQIGLYPHNPGVRDRGLIAYIADGPVLLVPTAHL